MANDYFSPSGAPATGGALASSPVRANFTAIEAAFDKLPDLTGVGNRIPHINAGSTAIVTTSGFTFDGTTLVVPAFAPTTLTVGTGGTSYGEFVKRATADQSITTNTTLASATNLSHAIAASEEWVSDTSLTLSAALATTGFKLAATFPVGATVRVSVGVTPTGVDEINGRYFKTTTTGGAALDFSAAELNDTGAGAMVKISIWVLNGANAGTVQLQIAQSTSSASALVLEKGSHMIAKRIA